MANPAPSSNTLSRFDATIRFLNVLVVCGLWLTAMIKSWWIVAGIALLAAVSGSLYLISGMTKLRFSLRTLLLLALWAGACGTLLTKIDSTALFALGISGSLLLFAFVIASSVRANIPPERLDAD